MPRSLAESLFASPHSAIAAITGLRVSPAGESLYSVFGGITGYSLRSMNPHAANSFSSRERMRSLIGGQAALISENLNVPSRTSAQMILAFQRPPRTREVKATGHFVGISFMDLY